LLTIV
jgi:H/ACA ribonucleoprotein complex subunit 4